MCVCVCVCVCVSLVFVFVSENVLVVQLVCTSVSLHNYKSKIEFHIKFTTATEDQVTAWQCFQCFNGNRSFLHMQMTP